VSPRPKEGGDGISAAFSTGQEQLPLPNLPDGTSNTILIVEAGNAVPWTKPEDLSYAADKPLPKLGGLFRDVFHAAFADGNVLLLTKQYDEVALRAAITANDGLYFNLDDIEAHPPRRIEKQDNKDSEGAAAWRQNNEYRRYLVERSRERLRLLKEEREVQR